jgi:DNA-binding transcriptional LysR family regulator
LHGLQFGFGGILPEKHLSLDDLRLLSAVEQRKSLAAVAAFLQRDKSVISRRLKELSQNSSSIEKIGTQWCLTEVGKKLTKLAMDFELEQQQILGLPTKLSIAGTRLFVSAFLATRLMELRDIFPNRNLTLISNDGPPEKLLLEGVCDLAFACGKPSDPSIAFRRSARELFFPVASTDFVNEHKCKDFALLQLAPHIAFVNLTGTMIFSSFLSEKTPVHARINDPVAVLNAVEAGLGWSVLPYYAVEEKVRSGHIKIFEEDVKEVELYGVWWLRSRTTHAGLALDAFKWLSRQSLEP